MFSDIRQVDVGELPNERIPHDDQPNKRKGTIRIIRIKPPHNERTIHTQPLGWMLGSSLIKGSKQRSTVHPKYKKVKARSEKSHSVCPRSLVKKKKQEITRINQIDG
jgi:hypothetical protein